MSRRAFGFLALLAAAVCLVVLPRARAGEVSHARIVRLSYTLGEVQMSADGASAWHKAIANTPLREGNSLATGDGRAEVEFELGAMAWMASQTVLEFPQLALEDGAKNTQLGVKQGTATFNVKPGRHDSFVVQAGQLTIAAAEASRFRVDVFEDGAAVSVLRGAVEVTARGTLQRMSGHQTLALRNDVPGNGVVTANPRNDAWDRWVSDRYAAEDAALARSTDYLNAPVGYGMADLSFYGGWVNVPGYGMGWQPYGTGLGWSPFYNGFWDAYGGMGPAWVSYEPWGWLPYHYGGWMYSPIYGWVWGPGGFGAWSPGTVFWTTTPVGRGWVPRAPNETLSGTPVNLARGVVTNTTAGMLAGSGNKIVRGADIGKAQITGGWTGEAHLGPVSENGPTQAATAGTAKSVRSAQRMPQGKAPRIASAGLVAGRVQVYQPPVPMRGSSSGFGSRGPARSAGSPSSLAGSSSSHSEAAPSHTSSGGASGSSGGSHGKP